MAKVTFRLVMPERELLNTEADMVVVPGSEGDFGVLHGHAPLISTVRPGVLEVLQGNKVEQRFMVAGGIAEVTPETCRDRIVELNGNGKDVDAIVQVGTNLSMVRLAAAAELLLGKPVIAINTATYWHALRQNGIDDKIQGFGRLLEEF